MFALFETQNEDDIVIKRYKCDFVVDCAGDSIWGDTANRKVRVNEITVIEEDDYITVNVAHDSTMDIYTDTGFELAISERLGFDVCFTEQGMQEDNFASLEQC